ncbi:MAG: uL14 family ribosomal protein [Candidatus Moeniiplasma glomeromycotorum]|nr:uL14 family ribosomal protein [Candidatus Moeniiplasma glomeromycotorum]MCE8164101.1 uL14 family ribosomal protein [Candidatus Moeniiplasma glomeromycotorum]MCE8166059.1 uL14 family ribosomal protein [Candidatus Moeniiplasma glomeromycotorum]MCE8168348.1 uL14 family ribosomal protein [Candidatus Moeniiplasma glomeromycotorum]MCE8169919.1 uL14 family ribosomal protein [Candidatus Moeniiplasma glomeromycotorum]
MLQNESRLQVVDNSGALEILVIRCLEGSNRRYSYIGNVVVATVKKVNPKADNVKRGIVKKGQVFKALIVNTRNRSPRNRNVWIRFSENCALLLKEEKDELLLMGTRIFVPLTAPLEKQWQARGKKYKSFLSLAPKIL